MRRYPHASALSICFLILSFFLNPVFALSAEPDKPKKSEKEAADLTDAVRKRDQVINDLLKRVEALEQEVRVLRTAGHTSPPAAEPSAGQPRVRKAEAAAEQKSVHPIMPSPPPPPDDREEEERLARETLERVLIEKSAVLLPAWALEIEPSLLYAHSSTDRIIINGVVVLGFGGLAIGDIVSERIRLNTLVSALTFRLGLPWDLQAEARFPFRWDHERVLTADVSEHVHSAFGPGDFEFALSRQLLREHGWVPSLVGTLRYRAPTGSDNIDIPQGTGFHGIQAALAAVKIKDPVAFFGGVNYTANLPEEKNSATFDPGDSMGFNLGMALALNPQTSINFQFDQRFINRTSVSGVDIPGTSGAVGVFRVGATYAFSRDYFMDFGVGIGLTEDAPDVQVSVAVPFRTPNILKKLGL